MIFGSLEVQKFSEGIKIETMIIQVENNSFNILHNESFIVCCPLKLNKKVL